MKKYLVWMEDIENGKKIEDVAEHTDFEYYIGETITVNSNYNIYKCVKKVFIDGRLYHYFKKGKITYSFD